MNLNVCENRYNRVIYHLLLSPDFARALVPWRNKAAGDWAVQTYCPVSLYLVKAIKPRQRSQTVSVNDQRRRAWGIILGHINMNACACAWCIYTLYVIVSPSLTAGLCTLGDIISVFVDFMTLELHDQTVNDISQHPLAGRSTRLLYSTFVESLPSVTILIFEVHKVRVESSGCTHKLWSHYKWWNKQ